MSWVRTGQIRKTGTKPNTLGRPDPALALTLHSSLLAPAAGDSCSATLERRWRLVLLALVLAAAGAARRASGTP
jgi:hypothetical protein